MRYNFRELNQTHPNVIQRALKEGKLDGSRMFIELPDTFEFGDCQPNTTLDRATVNTQGTVNNIPPDYEWPLLLRPLKWTARPQERGMGDIVERLIGADTSETFKRWWAENFKSDCGCNARKEWLNRRFPLV